MVANSGVDTAESEPLTIPDYMYANLHAWHVRKMNLHAFGRLSPRVPRKLADPGRGDDNNALEILRILATETQSLRIAAFEAW